MGTRAVRGRPCQRGARCHYRAGASRQLFHRPVAPAPAPEMNTASVVASLSRKAGGMFESVRRLHQSLAEIPGVNVAILGLEDKFTKADLISWRPLQVESFHTVGPARFGYSPYQLTSLFVG